ncbi:MAG: NAD(P)-dependent oxidoreductase [Melioribacter sp.]|nr:NAD(P)-dependent oxidoreductase [Melioribacter sp.]
MLVQGKILITGGLGFIGHHLAIALSKLNADALIYDNFDHKITNPVYQKFVDERIDMVKGTGYEIKRGDTKDFNDIKKIIEYYEPSRIVHLAAIPSAVLCNDNPSEGFDNNLTATKNILEILRSIEKKPEQFLFFSSSMVYGNFVEDTVTEESATNPIGIYGAAKLSSELLIKAYNHVFGIPYTIVRPSALYGPRCINRRITQIFIENALQGKPLYVEGDGSERLDFTNVIDVVNGIILMLSKTEAINQTFNLTYGSGRTINELAQIVQKYFPNVKIEYKPLDRLKPKRGTLDITRANKLLGYKSSISLESGGAEYIEWYLNNNFFKMPG